MTRRFSKPKAQGSYRRRQRDRHLRVLYRDAEGKERVYAVKWIGPAEEKARRERDALIVDLGHDRVRGAWESAWRDPTPEETVRILKRRFTYDPR